MKKLNINLLNVLFVIVLLPCCKPDSKTLSQSGGNGKTGLERLETPGGEKLLPAEEGPERNALGVPAIDLKTYKLEVTGLVDSSLSLTWNDIKAMPASQSSTILMYCVDGWEVYGIWEGIVIRSSRHSQGKA